VNFEECWQGRTEAEFEPLPLPVIGRAELIKNKRASGRAKDLGDVERLTSATKRPRAPRSR